MDHPTDYELLGKLIKLLPRKRSKQFYAEKLGVSVSEVTRLKKKLLSQRKKDNRKSQVKERKENVEKGTLESSASVKFEPSDHKQLAKIHKIDLSKFTIVNYWSKLQPNGDFTSSVFCKRKQKKDYSIEDFEKFLKHYKPNYKRITPPELDLSKETVDLELSISDFHLAKKYITDKSANVRKRAKKFYEIAESLVFKADAIYSLDTIVFPISNDFFHTDNYWNSTTNNTPQHVIAEFDEEYEVGFDILVKTIIMLKSVCRKVKVVLVPGNHDKTKSFYLAHGLSIFFRNDPDIEFLRDSEPVKGIVIGSTFIGYHHGNCKIDDLPLLFATSELHAKDFGNSKFREVHTGDKHHYMAKEVKGVRIQQMPSMSGTDRWHRDNNYVNNIRAALLLTYDKKEGKNGEFEQRI